MTILETHISLRLHRSTKNSKTNPILRNSHIYWVKFHSVQSQQGDLWPVATRKGQPVKNKHHCKYNPYLVRFCVLSTSLSLAMFPMPIKLIELIWKEGRCELGHQLLSHQLEITPALLWNHVTQHRVWTESKVSCWSVCRHGFNAHNQIFWVHTYRLQRESSLLGYPFLSWA